MKENVKITNTQFKKGLETKKNMLVFGPSGYGKTATVEEYAEENNLKIAYCDMAGQLPESIAGIPGVIMTKDETTGYYRRMLDVELKDFLECEGEGYILFFSLTSISSFSSSPSLYSLL